MPTPPACLEICLKLSRMGLPHATLDRLERGGCTHYVIQHVLIQVLDCVMRHGFIAPHVLDPLHKEQHGPLPSEEDYHGFQIHGPASSWPEIHETNQSSWPDATSGGLCSAGLSPFELIVRMQKDTYLS